MKRILKTVVACLLVLLFTFLGFKNGIVLDELQKETLKILVIICTLSASYCFVVGEISRNNSQMDKLWSILPIAYSWIVCIKSGMNARLIVMAVLITLWGIRLTYNFAKKGAYSLKFWSGEEDYRWGYLRKNKALSNKLVWGLFDFFFISIYQNAIVLAICMPLVAVMNSNAPFGVVDYLSVAFTLFFICYEAVADHEQRKFQTKKWNDIKSGKSLEELDYPYSLGFNTFGLWNISRHPNYLGEQAIWIGIYTFVFGALGVVFNYSIAGCMFLVLLFIGSSNLQEGISAKKYPKYSDYQRKVFKYLPIKKYREWK